jgi:hypothetical protein
MKIITWDIYKYDHRESGFNGVVVAEVEIDSGTRRFVRWFACDPDQLNKTQIATVVANMLEEETGEFTLSPPGPKFLLNEWLRANTGFTE